LELYHVEFSHRYLRKVIGKEIPGKFKDVKSEFSIIGLNIIEKSNTGIPQPSLYHNLLFGCLGEAKLI